LLVIAAVVGNNAQLLVSRPINFGNLCLTFSALVEANSNYTEKRQLNAKPCSDRVLRVATRLDPHVCASRSYVPER